VLNWRPAQEMVEQLAYPHGAAVRLLQDGVTVRVDGAIGAPRVVVKDLLDVAGLVTTGGSAALADDAPALTDAAVVARLRANGAAIIGKTALHELGRGTSGVNAWSGTPCNPLNPRLVPGGSSSGSAVAVAVGAADFALGTDTGGSIRIPAACCGVVGLKPTQGRLSLHGVLPLAPSLEVVGPLADSVEGIGRAMACLDPSWRTEIARPRRVGRIRVRGEAIDPRIDIAVDQALAGADVEVRDVDLPGWQAAFEAAVVILRAEGWRSHRHLLARSDRLGPGIAERIVRGEAVDEADYQRALGQQAGWRAELEMIFDAVDVLALPTLPEFPPALGGTPDRSPSTWLTLPLNFAGLPALALPIVAKGRLPASLQLVGPVGADEAIVLAASVIPRTRRAITIQPRRSFLATGCG
jgi:amidase